MRTSLPQSVLLLALTCALACSASPARNSAPATPDRHFVVAGATIVGLGQVDIEIRDGVIVAVGDVGDARRFAATGKWLVPAFIDSHVHLSYLPVADELAGGGVAAVVDLASPQSDLRRELPGVQIMRSGPMITSIRGYPTQSWGRDGYGVECADAACAASAADRLIAGGARVLKVPVMGSRSLPDAALRQVAQRAAVASVPVAAHALGDADAMRASVFDVLAHTPVEPLGLATIEAWREKTVVSTLSAFGGPIAVQNLRQLRQAGAAILYGTDLGNTREAAISREEIELLGEAGLDPAAIIRAGTSDPARFWGFDDLGVIAVGKRASFLILARDPLVDPGILAAPEAVFIRGANMARQSSEGCRAPRHRGPDHRCRF